VTQSSDPASPKLARFPLRLDQLDRQNRSPALTRKAFHPATGPATQTQLQGKSAGLGLDSAKVRQRMVQRLEEQGALHDAVRQALLQVERHRFVDTALAGQAYEDTSLPIGLSQTISKPSVVARMLSLLCEGAAARQSGHLGRVLEIGTGCGYQAALLCVLGRKVVSVERLLPLFEKARDNLAVWRIGSDLQLVHGDGRLGHGPKAPYQSIIAAAGGDALPPAWLDQLAEGGRLVAPVLDGRHGAQVLCVVDRGAEGLVTRYEEAVLFVPLRSGTE